MPRLVPLLLLCLVAASCAPDSEPPESTTTSAIPATSSTTTTLGPAESLAAFATCLRDAGVPVDPPIGSDLSSDLSAIASALDTSVPDVQAAIGECAALLTVVQRTELAGDPEIRQLVIGQLEAFAACMRGEGVDGFPDPSEAAVPGFDPDAVPFEAEGFDAAVEECRSLVGTFGMEG